MDHDLAADVDRVRACLFLNEDFRVLQDFFDLLDTRLDVSLLVLGSIVFSVLGKVALFTGLFNFLGNCLSLIDLQVEELVLKLFESGIGKNVFLSRINVSHLYSPPLISILTADSKWAH